MSNRHIKMKKPTLKVTPSSRVTNTSTSGHLHVNQSTTNTRSIYASFSRKSFSLAGDSKLLEKSSNQTPKCVVQVFDEAGEDVTPQPLYHPEPGSMQARQSKIFTANDTSGGTLSDFFSTVFQTTNASFAGPFTKSVFGSSSVSRSSQSTMESMTDEIEDPSSKRDVSISLSDMRVRREEVKELIQEDLLEEVVERDLTETDTIWLLNLPPEFVFAEFEEAEDIRRRNQAYEELCRHRQGNDRYVGRSMQTLHGAPKTKEVQSEAIGTQDKSTMATTWDMYDSYHNADAGGDVTVATEGERLPEQLEASTNPERSMSLSSSTCTRSSLDVRAGLEAVAAATEMQPDPEMILRSEKFQMDLLVMERLVLQNLFQPKQAAYRQLQVLQDPESGVMEQGLQQDCVSPALERLWSFGCNLTAGYSVSCMAWSRTNPDLLAVGYGRGGGGEPGAGQVCCWSLKNPMWPERIFRCDSGVTALDFSARCPCQLAVGMQDGTIATFDVRSNDTAPSIDSSDCSHKHMGPVWQLRWVDQERAPSSEDRRETLISVSADGRVSRWVLHKGPDHIDLMKLKRTNDEQVKRQTGEKERKTEVLISRQTPGLCFDFHPTDSQIYLVGTEEGHIHKCSCSYSEQFLETYRGHKGPVYKITWSPFCADVFLSSSSDWTVRLWRLDLAAPVLTFTSIPLPVCHVAWAPRRPATFGAVSEARVEIWDLATSTLDPVVTASANPGVRLTTLLFAVETDCVLVGDSEGQVSVYQLRNLTAPEVSQVDTLEDIIRSTLASQF